MSAAPIGPIFAAGLWRVAKAMNDAHSLRTMPPPTIEQRPCWNCGGRKYLEHGMCRLCDWRGMIEVEVRR